MTYAAVRIRGTVNINPDIKKTLQLLNLTKPNHCIILDENLVTRGMLNVAKDYLTWGEIEKDVLEKLIKSRGKIEGDKPITDEFIKTATSYKSISELSDAIINNKFKYKEIPSVKPIFRLNPPKRGYEGIKRSYRNKGALGYRGKDINKLIQRML